MSVSADGKLNMKGQARDPTSSSWIGTESTGHPTKLEVDTLLEPARSIRGEGQPPVSAQSRSLQFRTCFLVASRAVRRRSLPLDPVSSALVEQQSARLKGQ